MKTTNEKQSWGVITIECSSYKNKNGDTILERTVKYDDELLLQDTMPYAQYTKSKDIVSEFQNWASPRYKQSSCAGDCANAEIKNQPSVIEKAPEQSKMKVHKRIYTFLKRGYTWWIYIFRRVICVRQLSPVHLPENLCPSCRTVLIRLKNKGILQKHLSYSNVWMIDKETICCDYTKSVLKSLRLVMPKKPR